MSALPKPNPNANDVAACRRKRRYANFVTATLAAGRRVADGGPKLSAYRCPECGSFHLTKMDQA